MKRRNCHGGDVRCKGNPLPGGDRVGGIFPVLPSGIFELFTIYAKIKSEK